jgi:hypothetical protein
MYYLIIERESFRMNKESFSEPFGRGHVVLDIRENHRHPADQTVYHKMGPLTDIMHNPNRPQAHDSANFTRLAHPPGKNTGRKMLLLFNTMTACSFMVAFEKRNSLVIYYPLSVV